ncbi:MAG: class I SAM-dependent DNA methyltransferase [Anaerolineales bacterium]
MPLYDRFAPIYQRGPYVRFSQVLAETVLPDYLTYLDIHPKDVLDVACGEGSFAVEFARQGYNITGIDQSSQMIRLAQQRAVAENVSVEFLVEDMRALPNKSEFDLVTCWFDSLNYLLTVRDLNDAFKNAYDALRPGGFYMFDMNTIYGLAVSWMTEQTYINNEADDFIEIHQQEFDYENQIATMNITIFEKVENNSWERIEESHHERGYPIADIQFLLNQIGFEITGIYDSLSKRTDVRTNSPRVWFIVRKPVDIG